MVSSWGNYLKSKNTLIKSINWRDQANIFSKTPVLSYGNGRSYGDVCLNNNNTILKTNTLNRFIQFNAQTGALTCESGCLLSDILSFCIPQGWMLPVVPGTQFVTVGGAIANDVHGKNHHKQGTFGCHVNRFGLLRSDEQLFECSATKNQELYSATIGGLGLTGLILWAEIQLIPINSPYLTVSTTAFHGLDEFWELSKQSENSHEYTASWIDCQSQGKNFARGLFIKANHAVHNNSSKLSHRKQYSVPYRMPSYFLNPITVKAFNATYFYLGEKKHRDYKTHYESLFFPLDAVNNWNKAYGKKGFLQYQCVVPLSDGVDVISEVLKVIAKSGQGSFLSVLKTFGNKISPGYLSFPMPGITLALDFSNRGEKTIQLLHELDKIVISGKGRVYPAKDACMSKEAFQSYYGNALEKWLPWKDVGFCSDFWRRVMEL